MNDNHNKNSNHNKNKKNLNGLLIMVAWALVLTVAFNYLSAYSRQASTAATTHEIKYSQFLSMVEEDKVAAVEFVDSPTSWATPLTRTSPSSPCSWAAWTGT